MICSTYTKKRLVFHAVCIALLSVSGLMTAYSAVYTACRMHCREDGIVAGFTIFFALLILSVDFFECRAMGAQLYMNEDGLGARRFGKPKFFIKWNEIREVGTGSIPTPFGRKSRIYFCDRVLDQAERDDLITLKYHTVHFSYIPKSWYPEMCKRLPTPIAAEFVERYVR